MSVICNKEKTRLQMMRHSMILNLMTDFDDGSVSDLGGHILVMQGDSSPAAGG